MKASEIRAALSADKMAVFALRPSRYGLGGAGMHWVPSYLMGLEPAGRGSWTYSHRKTGDEPWQCVVKHSPCGMVVAPFVSSRDLIPLAEAERLLAERRVVREREVAQGRKVQSVVDRLTELGVKARSRGGAVEVVDPEALGRLLFRLG